MRTRTPTWVAGCALWLAACSQGAASGPSRPVAAPKPVQLVAVETAELPTTLAVPGVLGAQEELVLSLEVGGRLQTLAVDVGDLVAAGQQLAALDPRDLQLAIERTDAAIAASAARLGAAGSGDLEQFDVDTAPSVREALALVHEATLQRDRMAEMVQQNAQSGSTLDAAAAALAVAESRLQRARDEVRATIADVKLRRIERRQADKRLADSRLVAPFAGRVAARNAAAGQVVAAGMPLLTLLRVDPLRLRMRVPERDGAGIAVGQRVEFTVDGVAGAPRVGRVVRTGPLIERGDRTRLVEAEVDNAAADLLPGAFCRARIVVADAVPVVVVPRSAVVTFAGVDRVFTVENGKDGKPKAKGQILELGRAVGDRVEVVRGLVAGARIVRDATGLTPEVAVAVVE